MSQFIYMTTVAKSGGCDGSRDHDRELLLKSKLYII